MWICSNAYSLLRALVPLWCILQILFNYFIFRKSQGIELKSNLLCATNLYRNLFHKYFLRQNDILDSGIKEQVYLSLKSMRSLRSSYICGRENQNNVTFYPYKWNLRKWWRKFNPFHATGLFLYPLETENLGFYNIFSGYRKRWHEMG